MRLVDLKKILRYERRNKPMCVKSVLNYSKTNRSVIRQVGLRKTLEFMDKHIHKNSTNIMKALLETFPKKINYE